MVVDCITAGQARTAIHVWSIWLEAPHAVNRFCRSLLSPDEIARGDRFAFERLTRAYELSHGFLRLLLGGLLNCDPRKIRFKTGPMSKPALRDYPDVHFNMAHSGRLATYAFAYDCELGVDVEELRPITGIAQIASNMFCREEATQILCISPGLSRNRAFLCCWTRKEAYVKAVGDGLYHPLNQFRVSLTDGEAARFVHIGNDSRAAAAWTLQHLELAPNYVGAVAYRAAARSILLDLPWKPEEFLTEIRGMGN
jgi:4'-phosphopantetheinyl transferase